MNKRKRYGALPGLLMAGAAWAVLSGCAETSIVGSVLDADVRSGGFSTMLTLLRGGNSEVHDIMAAGGGFGGYKYRLVSATDDMLNIGAASSEELNAIGAWDPGQSNTTWEQGMEGSWSGLKVVNNMMGAFSTEVFETTPLVARAYLNSAWAERFMGDAFCQLAYGFNHEGGQDLGNLGSLTQDDFDNDLVNADSTYQRMVTFAGLALDQAERALAADPTNPVSEENFSDRYYDPQRLVTSSHAALAQAHHALAVRGVDVDNNWDAALAHAAEVPTDYIEFTIYGGAENQPIWSAGWRNDDLTWHSEEAATRPEGFTGVPASWFWGDDPRIELQNCLENSSGCAGFADGETESNDDYPEEPFPIVVPLKYSSSDSHDERVSGREMRLIEAEEALVRDNDFDTFYDKIDEVRAFYGADPTARPLTVGSLDWPNAQDDAMSILDRERYLSMWMWGRRMFDLDRWDHPYVANQEALTERHDDLLAEGFTRASCMPVAESECNINETIAGSEACGGA